MPENPTRTALILNNPDAGKPDPDRAYILYKSCQKRGGSRHLSRDGGGGGDAGITTERGWRIWGGIRAPIKYGHAPWAWAAAAPRPETYPGSRAPPPGLRPTLLRPQARALPPQVRQGTVEKSRSCLLLKILTVPVTGPHRCVGILYATSYAAPGAVDAASAVAAVRAHPIASIAHARTGADWRLCSSTSSSSRAVSVSCRVSASATARSCRRCRRSSKLARACEACSVSST